MQSWALTDKSLDGCESSLRLDLSKSICRYTRKVKGHKLFSHLQWCHSIIKTHWLLLETKKMAQRRHCAMRNTLFGLCTILKAHAVLLIALLMIIILPSRCSPCLMLHAHDNWVHQLGLDAAPPRSSFFLFLSRPVLKPVKGWVYWPCQSTAVQRMSQFDWFMLWHKTV